MKITNIDSAGKIQLKLAEVASATQCDWTVSYYDVTISTWVVLEWSYTWVSNGVTAVDILPAPASGHVRTMKSLTCYNADNITHTVILQLVDGWGTRVLVRNSLTTLASWSSDDMSFYTDISGKLDTSALSDTAYWAWWNWDTTHTATKNAVYDKIETLSPIDSPVFTTKIQTPTIELWAASDTTLARDSAWVISVEWVVIPSISSTNTLTNKRITKRVASTTDAATSAINTDTTDEYVLTAIANATTFTLTGTPTDWQKLIVKFKDAGTAKGLTWTGFTAIGITLPTTTVANKVGYVWCIYNGAATRRDAVAYSVES